MLFDKVCEHLNLLERDYFGITHRDVENQKVKEILQYANYQFLRNRYMTIVIMYWKQNYALVSSF